MSEEMENKLLDSRVTWWKLRREVKESVRRQGSDESHNKADVRKTTYYKSTQT